MPPSVDCYHRRKKFLLALQGLKGAQKLEPASPELRYRMVEFFHNQSVVAAGAEEAKLHAKVLEVIALVQKEMLGGKSVADYAQVLSISARMGAVSAP
jgi:hypothetical protein